jgi:predicted permease
MDRPWILGVARRLVSLAMYAFPRSFRERHAEDALGYFEDRARERLALGTMAVAWLTVTNVVNALASGLAERGRTLPRPRSEGLPADVVQGVRSLRRNPRFVVGAALPIALGIAGVTAVVAVVDSVLIRPLPYADASRLVKVGRPLESGVLAPISTANLIDLEERSAALEVAGVQGGTTLVFGDDGAEMVSVTRPTRRYLDVMGLRPLVGRGFGEEDFLEPRAVLVTWGFWQRRWGGDPEALGSTLRTELGTLTVVGVLPREWTPPEAVTGSSGELWVPIDYDDPMVERTRAFGFTGAVARLARGATIEQANEELRGAAAALADEHPGANRLEDGTARQLEARSLHSETVGEIAPRLGLILGAVLILLAVACANVANLFLARGTERRREIALRTALGAGRGRLLTQLFTESLGVAALGGLAGCLLAWVSTDALAGLVPELPRAETVRVDLRVVAASIGVTLCSALAFGLAPALTHSSMGSGLALRESRDGSRAGSRLRTALVVGQVALAIVLVTAGGLLTNSVVRLGLVDVGYRTSDVLFMRPRMHVRADGEEASAYLRSLSERLEALPGISHVSGSMFVPGEGRPVVVDLEHPASGDTIQRLRHTILPGLFSTLDIPMLAGGSLDPLLGPDDPPTAVVSRGFADELWPGEAAVGRTFEGNDGRRSFVWTVVGVVEDIRTAGPREPPMPLFYTSFHQDPWLASMALIFRFEGHTADLAPSLRRVAADVDHDAPVREIGSLSELVRAKTVQQRHYALLLGLFSAIALAIAAVGVHATTAFAVSARLREMGIRRAVGATGRDVVTLVVAKGLAPAALGALIGLGLAVAATRGLRELLYGVTTTDPGTYGTVAAVLLLVAIGACASPARRVVTADPAQVLRSE